MRTGWALVALLAALFLLALERRLQHDYHSRPRNELSFDFVSRAQLLGGTAQGGEVQLLAQGLRVMPHDQHVMLSLVLPKPVPSHSLRQLRWQGFETTSLPMFSALALRGERGEWIATLPDSAACASQIQPSVSCVAATLDHKLDLTQLKFVSEPERNDPKAPRRALTELGPLQSLGLYRHDPLKRPFLLAQVGLLGIDCQRPPRQHLARSVRPELCYWA
jgi:hypothetical protein